jgi:ATP-dependent DNA helicase RecQ
MAASLIESLQTTFGFPDFRDGQQPAIESILSGQDTLVVMPTGSGKSLIYQLAALNLPGLTLVVSPLIALMKDQVDSLTACQAPAAFINSAQSPAEQAARLSDVAAGRIKLLYVAPERLRNAALLTALEGCPIGLLAVDEAHCISHWGHDFRPDYLHIAGFGQRANAPVVVALTATATVRVQEDIVQQLAMRSPARVITGFNRPNLTFDVQYTYGEQSKLMALAGLLRETNGGATIVYTGTRRHAELVAQYAGDLLGQDVAHYHAGLPAERRTQVQDAFMTGRVSLVAATNAFGMGIDRADVRRVVHFAMPGALEAYYQEAGRAGRDGKPATATLLYSPEDRALQEWFIENSVLAQAERRLLFDTLGALNHAEVRTSELDLALRSGLHETQVRLGLSDLEEAGAIQHVGDVGTQMILRVGQWDARRVAAVGTQSLERRRDRMERLDEMVRYAESNACRRRILLDYFGDSGSAAAPRCCDNCLAQASAIASDRGADRQAGELSERDRVALAILDAVRRLRFPLGRERLAQVLRGARSRELREWGLDSSTYYGRLADYRQMQVREMIDELGRQGFLKLVGGSRPVLSLTPRGEDAIRSKASISLGEAYQPARRRERATGRAHGSGDTVELTGQLFHKGKGPAEIAAERGLAVGTIYHHLATLIARGEAPVTAVVSEEVILHVYAAIASVGDVSRLSPIRAVMSIEVSWEEIRCAVAGWQWEHRQTAEQSADLSECNANTPGPQ